MSRPVKTATCHPDRKHVARGLCRICYDREWKKAHYHANSELHKDLNAANYKKHAERRKAYQKEWYRNNPEKALAHNRKAKYGLTQEMFDAIVAEQGGRCAGCGTKNPTHVDHCHDLGHVRMILCRACNLGLGFFKNSAVILRHMADQLDRRQYAQ